MLSTMLYLNTRHALPTVGMQSKKSTLDSHSIPAELHTNIRMARSNKSKTQPTLDINSYPSRYAYGHRNNNDLTKEFGQRGYSDISKAISEHTRRAWTNIEHAARPNRQVQIEYYKRQVESIAEQKRYIVARHIPDPEIHIDVGEIVGEPDTGEYKTSIDTTPFASVEYNQGSIDIYLEDEGFIRHWVSQGKYDIYA